LALANAGSKITAKMAIIGDNDQQFDQGEATRARGIGFSSRMFFSFIRLMNISSERPENPARCQDRQSDQVNP
jgi:hypothetical protein